MTRSNGTQPDKRNGDLLLESRRAKSYYHEIISSYFERHFFIWVPTRRSEMVRLSVAWKIQCSTQSNGHYHEERQHLSIPERICNNNNNSPNWLRTPSGRLRQEQPRVVTMKSPHVSSSSTFPQPSFRTAAASRGGSVTLKSVLNLSAGLVFVGSILFLSRSPPSSIDAMTSVATSSTKQSENGGVGGFQFEVEGKVQGVYFRKHTQKQAREIGSIVGWIRNTSRGTVEGEVASRSLAKRTQLRDWLRTTGSPKSEIRHAHFQELSMERVQELLDEMDDFEVKKTTRKR